MYEKTGLSISQMLKGHGFTNKCEFCAMDDKEIPADFIYEIRYFYSGFLADGKANYQHGSVCRSHVVALAENYRDMTS